MWQVLRLTSMIVYATSETEVVMNALLFRNTRLGVKFSVVGITLLAIIVGSLVVLARQMTESIHAIMWQMKGLLVHQSLRPVLDEMQKHRAASTNVLSGKNDLRQRMELARAAIDGHFKQALVVAEGHGAKYAASQKLTEIRTQWEQLKTSFSSSSPEQNFKRHTEMIRAVLTLMQQVGLEAKLVLDTEIGTYSLMQTAVKIEPALSEDLGQTRGYGAALLARASLKREDVARLIEMYGSLRARDVWLREYADRGMSADPAIRPTLEPLLRESSARSEQFITTIGDVFVRESSTLKPADYFELGTAAIDGNLKLYVQVTEAFKLLAQDRIARLSSARMMVVGGMTFALLLGGLIAVLILRDVVKRLGRASFLAPEMAAGKIEHRVDVLGRDEVGAVLASVGAVQQRLTQFAAAELDMARAHEFGAIDHRIDAMSFPGIFGELATRVNGLVHSHVETQFRFIEVVEQYAEGDFSGDMPALPGKQAAITAAAGQTKVNLLAIADEVNRLVKAAADGNFEARSDAAQFSNTYHDMIEALNSLMSTCHAGLHDSSRMFAALAQGDLRPRIDASYRGTFDDMKKNANATMEQLGELIRQVRDAVGAISTASSEIAGGNAELSTRTEEQASSLEQTAASMEELTSTVKLNGANASQAHQVFIEASDQASRGGDTVRRVVDRMSAISAQSKRIQDIIGAIDRIVFQTNILALNAAVKAARAGEQGRGFAVVASEVRQLAQRSATAAREIKAIIGESVANVDDGTLQAAEAGSQMIAIVDSVKRLNGIIGEISTASVERGSGIEQVAQAVTQMDHMTQQNASLVEEAAAASEALAQQANRLMGAVEVFKLRPLTQSTAQLATHIEHRRNVKAPRAVAAA